MPKKEKEKKEDARGMREKRQGERDEAKRRSEMASGGRHGYQCGRWLLAAK